MGDTADAVRGDLDSNTTATETRGIVKDSLGNHYKKTDIISILGDTASAIRGDLDLAKKQIDLACACGCDAVKFQVYDTDRLYNGDKTNPSYKDSQRGWFSYKNFRVLADYSPIEWFAASSSNGAVALLEDIGVSRYKIASRSVIDHKLLKAIAKTKKPLLS